MGIADDFAGLISPGNVAGVHVLLLATHLHSGLERVVPQSFFALPEFITDLASITSIRADRYHRPMIQTHTGLTSRLLHSRGRSHAPFRMGSPAL